MADADAAASSSGEPHLVSGIPSAVPGRVQNKRQRRLPSRILEPPKPDTAAPAKKRSKKRAKKRAKKKGTVAAAAAVAEEEERARRRRCGHCEAEKTPMWRAGPAGRKTLCNACGVRYRLGRLLPEYRPVASPSFVASEHSNSHREVLRRHHKKMQQQQGEEQRQLIPPHDDSVLIEEEEVLIHVPSSLLFDGPSAPLIIAGDDF